MVTLLSTRAQEAHAVARRATDVLERDPRERLRKLDEVTARLQQLRGLPTYERHRWAVERGLHLGAEIILDIGFYITTTHLHFSTGSSDHTLKQLRRQHVISPDLSDSIRELLNLRTNLVRGDPDLDRDLVEQHLQKAPEVFAMFRQAVERWLDERDDENG